MKFVSDQLDDNFRVLPQPILDKICGKNFKLFSDLENERQKTSAFDPLPFLASQIKNLFFP